MTANLDAVALIAPEFKLFIQTDKRINPSFNCVIRL